MCAVPLPGRSGQRFEEVANGRIVQCPGGISLASTTPAESQGPVQADLGPPRRRTWAGLPESWSRRLLDRGKAVVLDWPSVVTEATAEKLPAAVYVGVIGRRPRSPRRAGRASVRWYGAGPAAWSRRGAGREQRFERGAGGVLTGQSGQGEVLLAEVGSVMADRPVECRGAAAVGQAEQRAVGEQAAVEPRDAVELGAREVRVRQPAAAQVEVDQRGAGQRQLRVRPEPVGLRRSQVRL